MKNIKLILLSIVAIITIYGCSDKDIPNEKKDYSELSKVNGLWNLEILNDNIFLLRDTGVEHVKFELTFSCNSWSKSYFVLNDTIKLFINENPMCHEISDYIGRKSFNNIKNAIYIEDGEIRGLNLGIHFENDIAMATNRVKYREYKAILNSRLNEK